MTKIPLLLVPGALCTEVLWAPQVAALADIAAPTVTDEHLRHDDIGAIAEAILAAAPARFALAGLSFGGHVCFDLLRRAPERIDRVALLDTSARADSAARRAARRRDIDSVKHGRFVGMTERLVPVFLHPAHVRDRALVERVKAMTAGVGAAAFLRQQRAILGRPDSRPMLGSIRCPTLVLTGAEDRLTPPKAAEEIAAGIPDSRLVIVPHCGHLSTLEQPAAVNAALRDWLAMPATG